MPAAGNLKRCTKCGKEKPPAEFSRDRSRKDGRFRSARRACGDGSRRTRSIWPTITAVGSRRTERRSEPRTAAIGSGSARTPTIGSEFPNLVRGHYSVSSPQDSAYNCIALAASDTTRWWWPMPMLGPGEHWPIGAGTTPTISNFQLAFESLGYEVCPGLEHEPGYEKVAIFAAGGAVKHAARQRRDGSWLSKLGRDCDIAHVDVTGLEGTEYGGVSLVMKRQLTP